MRALALLFTALFLAAGGAAHAQPAPGQGPCVQPTLACANPTPISATTASLGGSALTIGQCSTVTVAVPFATTSMAVAVAPQTYPGAGYWWDGYVSAANTVTVRVCSSISGTPTASLYSVRVLP